MVDFSTRTHNPLPRQNDANKLIHLLESLSERVGPYILESGAPTELTLQQIRALSLLKRGPRNISHLADQLGMTPSAATSFLDRLEGKGLVQRFDDPDDRRVVKCGLTPLGMEESQSLSQIDRQRVGYIVNLLSESELESISCALDVLLNALDRETSSLVQRPSDRRS
jgi:DNA-binding MarR family transcriptional regulator